MAFVSKYFYILASLILTGYLLIVAKFLINPLLAAFILALSLNPLVNWMENHKIPRIFSTLLTVFLLMAFILAMIVFFGAQVGAMDFEFGDLNKKFNGIAGKAQHFLSRILGVSPEEQVTLMRESLLNFLKNSASVLNNTVSFTTQFLSGFVLFILALFFFLYYRRFFVLFLYQLFNKKQHSGLNHILRKTQSAVNHYIFGLSLVIVIVAILNSSGLLLLGIENAITFGVFAAILTLVPYVGILIGSLIPALFALLTKDSLWFAAGVIFVFALVQFLEGNLLTPNIVGRQVRINPFAAILGLIIGGMLLGMVGIIFALPVLAIIKVICDEFSALKPIGFLLGQPEELNK